jgi:hypothetical protein
MVIAAWSATGDPLHLAPAWAHLVASARLPVNGPLDAGSYIEADGFYRLKTLLRDGADVWMTWKPGVPEPLQVLHVTATEVRAIDLGFGQGVQGHEIWPQVARTADNGHPSIALLAGNQFDRPYLGAKPIFQVHEGFWAKELKPPRAPMYLACVDARTERVRWTTEVPGMTPNEPVGQIVRTHLVCTGNWAWVGCVITAGAGEAHLRLVAYDLRADSAIARIHEVPLGFAGHDFPDSTLTDLIAADGRIFALVHRAAELTPRVVRWDRQIVLALEPGTTP